MNLSNRINRGYRTLTFVVLCNIVCSVATAQEKPIFDTQKGELSKTSHALKSVRLPRGFHATLFATEPAVRQPIGFTTDERGRIWVAENYTYAENGFDDRFNDRIIILEDTDNDGIHDKRTVFWDKAKHLTSVEVGHGGVWLLCAPHLLFIPDRNRDDKPDGPPEVVLEGFNVKSVAHNIVNGLRWGPDGWLYGRHGILATSVVGAPGAPSSNRVAMNCALWRYHPIRKKIEIVTRGTTNSWGHDFDDFGQMFFINTVIGHLWHVVPGAHFQRMYGTDFDPHLYQLIGQTADHYHWDTAERWNDIRKGVTESTSKQGGGHAHSGMMIYLGNNWPKKYRNEMFTINLHGRRLNQDHLQRQHNGYVGKHRPDFIHFDDTWFRGVELFYSHDGGVFVLDWSDIGECHENDGVHRTSGRIFKITYGKPNRKAIDLNDLKNRELVRLQLDENEWWVRQSRRILQERFLAGKSMTDAKRQLDFIYREHSDVRKRLRAMWATHLIGGASNEWLLEQTNDEEEHIRVWALRLLVDREAVAELNQVLPRLAKDKSGLVRLFTASAMKSLELSDRWDIAQRLCQFERDNDDNMQGLMIWYAVEPAVTAYPEQAIRLVTSSKIHVVRELISRRITSEIEKRGGTVDKLVKALGDSKDEEVRSDIVKGMHDALFGWRKAKQPDSWLNVAARLSRSKSKELTSRVEQLSVVFGDGRALAAVSKLVNDNQADIASRRRALEALIQSDPEGLVTTLKKLIGHRELSEVAVRGLARFEDPQIAKQILRAYPRYFPSGKEAAIDTLSARKSNATELLKAIEQGIVNRDDVTAFHARQIYSLGDHDLRSRLLKTWGPVRQTTAQRKEKIASLHERLSDSTLQKANRQAGRAIFEKNCANCHTLFGSGGRVGPDLTGANRKNLYYLLENIIDPSGSVAKQFRVTLLRMENGQSVSGIVVRRDNKTTIVQTLKEQVVLQNDEIEEQKLQDKSIMPDNLLNQLEQQEVADLIAYLMGQTQVRLKSTEAEQ